MIIPVSGAANQNQERCSTLAPNVCKIRLAFAFCKANPNCIPKNPKLMFHI